MNHRLGWSLNKLDRLLFFWIQTNRQRFHLYIYQILAWEPIFAWEQRVLKLVFINIKQGYQASIYKYKVGFSDCLFVLMSNHTRAAVVHLNFRARSIFPVSVCTVPPGQRCVQHSLDRFASNFDCGTSGIFLAWFKNCKLSGFSFIGFPS